MAKKLSDVPPELEELVDLIGGFVQHWGFKKIQGRIWAHLYLSAEPLDASQLMKRLSISKALVSISVREMMEYAVINEVGKSDRGTVLYRANSDQESVILNVLRRRERLMLSKVSAVHRLCEGLSKDERKRLGVSDIGIQGIGELISKAEGFLDMVLATQTSLKSKNLS